MWGTYWVWDPRLTSELILLFLYLGYMGLRSALDDVQRADRVSAVLAVVGVVDVPIIHFSVTWWNSLHQAPSVMKLGKPTMPPSMFVPLLLMLLGFTLFFVALLLVRVRGEVLSRERTASWIREALTGMSAFLRHGRLCAHMCGRRMRSTFAIVALNIIWARRLLKRSRKERCRRLAHWRPPMTPRRRRLALVLGILAGVASPAALALQRVPRRM